MKNKIIKSVTVSFFCFLFSIDVQAQNPAPFKLGEELIFKVTYGFLDAAEAKMVISPDLMIIKNNPAYKIDVFGKTLGIFKLFKVNDNWGSYLDTTKIIPYQAYRHIEEGRYRKHERIIFKHQENQAHVRLYDRDNKKLVETKEYPVPGNVQDLVSGFYFLRTMNLNKYKKGDMITITGFFDKEIHNLKLIYKGKETISTEVGKFETIILSPIMPKNKLFRGDDPVTIWISDDQNKIPLKIKAKLMVGSLNMDIIQAKELRNN